MNSHLKHVCHFFTRSCCIIWQLFSPDVVVLFGRTATSDKIEGHDLSPKSGCHQSGATPNAGVFEIWEDEFGAWKGVIERWEDEFGNKTCVFESEFFAREKWL